MKEKKKKPSLLLPLGAAALLIGGGAGAYWAFMQRGVSPGALPIGAEVIPQDALMAVSVTTEPRQWQNLREFGTEQSQAALDQNLAQLRDRILTANGFNYETDIQPWIGKEVTVALLSPATAPAPGNNASPPPPPTSSQATVMVLPIQDPLKAKEILEKPRPQTGTLTERTYKDVKIQESAGAAGQKFAVAALDGKLLVVTNDPQAMNRAIDTYKGAPSLAATPGYSQALGKIQTAQPFGQLYVNLPAAGAVSAANAGRPVSPQNLPQVQEIQGLAATASLQPEGVLFKSISWLKPDSQRKYDASNATGNIASRLPADTMVMVSGGNLQKFWRDYSQGAATSPIAPIKPKELQEGVQSTVGMDLEKDFLAWMQGEFALALVTPPEGNQPTLPFSLLFMVKSSDRRAAETALKQLDQAMVSKYKFKVEEAKVGNQTVTNWSLPIGGPAISHGWLDGDVAFLSMGAPIVNVIMPKPTAALADSDLFKQGIPTDLKPNNGHFFANVSAINTKNLPLFQLPPGNREFVAAIRSIGVTAAISDERSTRYDALVLLPKAGNPKPLPSPTVPPAIAPGASPAPDTPNNPALDLAPGASPELTPVPSPSPF
jgi:hypothetical protein